MLSDPGPAKGLTLGAKRLACAVLASALEDLESTNPGEKSGAIKFLLGGGLFGFWCQVAGYDPGPAVERARQLIESKNID